MEQLIIFVLFVLGSIISAVLQKKKAQAEREAQRDRPRPSNTARAPSGEPPVPHWPKGIQQWQKELKRLLEEQMVPPVLPKETPSAPQSPQIPPAKLSKPVIVSRPPSEGELSFPTPLRESVSAYSRAARIDKETATRMQAVEQRTERAKPDPVPRVLLSTGPMIVQRWIKTPQSIREAFVASLVFGQPRSLEPIQ
jgi:hypothetical protein